MRLLLKVLDILNPTSRILDLEILSLSITGRIFGHFTGRVHGLGCGLESFLGLEFKEEAQFIHKINT